VRLTLAVGLTLTVQLCANAIGAQTNYPHGRFRQTSSQSTNSPNIAFIRGNVTLNYYNCVADPTTPSRSLYAAGLVGSGIPTIDQIFYSSSPQFGQTNFGFGAGPQSIGEPLSIGLSTSSFAPTNISSLGSGFGGAWNNPITFPITELGGGTGTSDAHLFGTGAAPAGLRLAVLSSPGSSDILNVAIGDPHDPATAPSWLITSLNNNAFGNSNSSTADLGGQFTASTESSNEQFSNVLRLLRSTPTSGFGTSDQPNAWWLSGSSNAPDPATKMLPTTGTTNYYQRDAPTGLDGKPIYDLGTSDQSNARWLHASSTSTLATQTLPSTGTANEYRLGAPTGLYGLATSDQPNAPGSSKFTIGPNHFAMGWDAQSLQDQVSNLQATGKKVISWTISYSDGTTESKPADSQPKDQSAQ